MPLSSQCEPGVKTLRKHPILAAVIWLLGGSTTEVEVPQDQNRRGEVKRLRWGPSHAPVQGNRVMYYMKEVSECPMVSEIRMVVMVG